MYQMIENFIIEEITKEIKNSKSPTEKFVFFLESDDLINNNLEDLIIELENILLNEDDIPLNPNQIAARARADRDKSVVEKNLAQKMAAEKTRLATNVNNLKKGMANPNARRNAISNIKKAYDTRVNTLRDTTRASINTLKTKAQTDSEEENPNLNI
jgi:hypothetical protein